VVLISSAEVTANEVYARLKDGDLLRRDEVLGNHRFITSSDSTTFGELGRRFLGPEFRDVEVRSWDT
jgi:glutamate racemase